MTVEKGKLDEDYFGTPLNVAMSVPFTIEVGDIILGRISKVDEEFVYVSTGFKSEGRIPVAEFRRGPDADKEWKIDDEVEVMVDRVSGEDIYLSYEKVVARRLWDTLAKKHEDGEPVEAEIIQQVKGGYRTDIGLPRHAFLPGSHLGIQTQASELIGKKLPVYIIEFNTETENIVVSHREWLKKQQDEAQGEAFETLQKDSIIDGRVTRLTNFGAFVDIGGGVEGLVHVSEIAWSRVGHPSQALSCGQEVKVKVLDFDPDSKRISLSMKQAAGDPWDKVDEHFAVGEIIVGSVVKMVKFGAFVMLRDGFEGLLHISELEQEKSGGENIKLNSGDEVKVKILNVDPKGRRIKLGLPVEKSSKVSGEFKQYIDNGSSGISIGDMIDLDKNKE